MSEHNASISWSRGESEFDYDSYPRSHRWSFDAEVSIEASAAPAYRGREAGAGGAAVDPEAALVASIASCHMLTFLAVAARRRLVVDRYEDHATGFLEKNVEGRLAITRVALRPRIDFAGAAPAPPELERLHEMAHRNCFIANSVRCEVSVSAPLVPRG